MSSSLCDGKQKLPLYREVAARITRMIEQRSYSPGERLPSIRELSQQLRVSINTVSQAYALLETSRAVEARPQSGYYVHSRAAGLRVQKPQPAPSPVTIGEDKMRIMDSLADERLVPLGRGAPSPDLLPAKKLNQMLAAQARYFSADCVSYAARDGLSALRTQIAKRSLDFGCAYSPDEVVITSGCVEAVTLALHAICQPGDTVVVESPVYYTFLNMIQWLGLKALEIPASPGEGMNLDILAYALQHNTVRACLIISNFNNPLGGAMPEEKKRELVKLLAKNEIPLIEDDVYGDLSFADRRPPVCKAYDEKGLVLLCSSFSKTLAPGYRVGWIVPGRFQAKVRGLKSLFNLATASPTQRAIAEFLSSGGYDRHLRAARRILHRRMEWLRELVARSFPAGTQVTHPEGGLSLWVELPPTLSAFKLYELSLREGIGIAPGPLFGTKEQFGNCLRLNGSFSEERVKRAVETIASLAKSDAVRL